MKTITTAALVKRINRALAPEDLKVVKLRGKAAEEHGEFVQIPIPNMADVIGWGRNGPPSRFEPVFDLERLGRDLGALANSEDVVDPEDELKKRTMLAPFHAEGA